MILFMLDLLHHVMRDLHNPFDRARKSHLA